MKESDVKGSEGRRICIESLVVMLRELPRNLVGLGDHVLPRRLSHVECVRLLEHVNCEGCYCFCGRSCGCGCDPTVLPQWVIMVGKAVRGEGNVDAWVKARREEVVAGRRLGWSIGGSVCAGG